jgi:hypothetical protein
MQINILIAVTIAGVPLALLAAVCTLLGGLAHTQGSR